MSLKGVNNTPSDGARILSVPERLAKYVEDGDISTEVYNELIEKYGSVPISEKPKRQINKGKLKKIAYIVLCIILLISLVAGAVAFYNDAIDNAYGEGRKAGYDSGHSIGYSVGYKKGYAYYTDIKDEYRFYHNGAVITTTTGKRYHRYGCYHIKNRSIYIFNIENAKAQGYTKCLDCFD